MGKLPDEVLNFTKNNWTSLGLTPVVLYRLVERGWEHADIDSVLTKLIGNDYASIKVTEWIDRLEFSGIKIPDEEPPFVEVIDRLIFVTIAQNL